VDVSRERRMFKNDMIIHQESQEGAVSGTKEGIAGGLLSE